MPPCPKPAFSQTALIELILHKGEDELGPVSQCSCRITGHEVVPDIDFCLAASLCETKLVPSLSFLLGTCQHGCRIAMRAPVLECLDPNSAPMI